MKALADILADSVAFAAQHDGEEITYLPGGSAPGFAIRAVVRRAVRETDGSDRRELRRRRAQITITSRASDGIESIDVRRDRVLLPEQPEDAETVTWNVVEILDQDPGTWRLELER